MFRTINKNMKEQILKLRSEGKTYNQIAEILKCSKSTICYHCGPGQKEKFKERSNKFRSENKINSRVHKFLNRKLYFSTLDFQRKKGLKIVSFSYKDVIKKFGKITNCYISGLPLNLLTGTNYELDHIIPVKKGGTNALENLGILHKTVNQMKHSLTNEELITWCKIILENNGYKVDTFRPRTEDSCLQNKCDCQLHQ